MYRQQSMHSHYMLGWYKGNPLVLGPNEHVLPRTLQARWRAILLALHNMLQFEVSGDIAN